ncbi:MAG: hypothetical protein ABI651_15495 [Verrucomicrobiota bacterium]
MHYANNELTASLPELTSNSEQQPGQNEDVLPSSIAAGEFTVSKEVESFLEKTREYSVRTRNVNIGTY